MSVRDLLTFNLFLQLIDGFVSHQAFALGATEANPVVAAANCELGNGLGTGIQQSFGVSTAAPDLCAQTQPALNHDAGTERDRLGIRVCHFCLPLATPAIDAVQLRSISRLILR